MVANHDLALAGTEDALDELKCDAGKAVAMEDHNLADAASDGALQKGDEPTPVEVDAGRNVFNDVIAGVALLEEGTLASEVFLLILGGDPAVDDFAPRLARGSCLRFGELEAAEDVRHVVEALTGGGAHADTAHPLGFSP